MLKGFYLKPQAGIGFYGSGDKDVQDYLTSTFNYTLRGQAGYLFKVGGSGNKQSFLDLGFALHTINNPILTTNYYGISLKYLWGTK